MSTVAVGTAFEDEVYETMAAWLNAGRLYIAPQCARLHRRPAYFSRDRNDDIVFDMSIEVFRPESDDCAFRLIIECKKYGGRVPVNDVEEFFAKVQQVAGANVKALMITNDGFQEGALAYAKSKGIGLARHFGDLEWVLERSTFAREFSIVLRDREGYTALTTIGYRSRVCPFYCGLGDRYTASLGVVVSELAASAISDAELRDEVLLVQPPQRPLVQYVAPAVIERRVDEVLHGVGYAEGPVPLDDICAWQASTSGLTVRTGENPGPDEVRYGILGRFTLDPYEIVTYVHGKRERERFTLAHELGHLLLGHSQYLRRETCAESDLEPGVVTELDDDDVHRLDWQANHFASCLLLPAQTFLPDFLELAGKHELRDHGHGLLYVDHQPVNLRTYYAIINVLTAKYDVSRTVANVRLSKLGLLNDARDEPRRARRWSEP